MTPMTQVASQTLEFHRFGDSEGLLSPQNRYIRAAGWDRKASEVAPTLKHRDFLITLNMLRYGQVAGPADVARAESRLAKESQSFLDAIAVPGEGLLQVDLVTNAAELWAFPFEAVFADKPEWLERDDAGVVLTRRIRGDFSETATPWPVVPRVLMLHAPEAFDLEEELIEAHADALREAVRPWAKGADLSQLLAVRAVQSAADIDRYRREFNPTYIHLLAHGGKMPPDPWLPQEVLWGLRLGPDKKSLVSPADIAKALAPRDGLPMVVTLAACDAANQAEPALATRSIVQDLHELGVPVVVGSQLPLTKSGSSVLAATFYKSLLTGDDVRLALHRVRVTLKGEPRAGHDWLSLVAYVRLPPEGYGAFLDEVGLKMELRLLNAAQGRSDRLSAEGGDLADFDDVEKTVRERLQSLSSRRARVTASRMDLLEECWGLEASANKRIAELLFVRGRFEPAAREELASRSKAALETALAAYRAAYDANINSHWLGIQQLALELALTGAVSRPDDWLLVKRAVDLSQQKAVRDGGSDVWSFGTLAELLLLAPRVGRARDLTAVKDALSQLVALAQAAGDPSPIDSTRRQLARYTTWWTRDNGYFPVGDDLSADAAEALQALPI